MDILNQSLGKLARDIPGATAVFFKQDLDFCCGGAKSLREGLAEKGLDPEPIVVELEQLIARHTETEAFNDWSNDELIEHILDRYHDVHREQLPELIRLAQRVERVHGARPDCPSGLWVELEKLLLNLEEHMDREEKTLFPMISRNMEAMARSSIVIFKQEHEAHGESLAAIDKITNGITIPKGACNTWRALYLGLSTFKSDFMNHIHLENNILFERVVSAE